MKGALKRSNYVSSHPVNVIRRIAIKKIAVIAYISRYLAIKNAERSRQLQLAARNKLIKETDLLEVNVDKSKSSFVRHFSGAGPGVYCYSDNSSASYVDFLNKTSTNGKFTLSKQSVMLL